ncbi:hypothetical protein [Cohnella soli]|uniref:DUF5325 family protein n=1 Tax=Cohnella soli TaxID=425005 RepID=A0ABW0HZC3_9BACL
MSKILSLFFAILSIAFLTAASFSISHSGWLTLLFAVLFVVTAGSGFVVKARLRRKNG